LPPGPAGIVSTGAIDNDAVTLPPATGSYDTKNAGSGKTVTLTGLALGTAIDSTGAAVFGYQLAPLSPANTIGTITPAALTIAAAPNTKTYDGTVASSATPTASGLVAGDTLTELAESFDSRNAGSRTLSVTGFAVGDGNGGNNYVVTTKTAAGTIDPAALTIAAAPSTRTYDGTTASSATPIVSGLVAGDTVSGLAQTFDSRNAGSRTLSIGGGFAVGDGNGGNNYVLTTKTAPGTISRARLTVTAAPNTKVFDGGVDAAALPTITTGALASGDSSVLSETYADPSVGTGKILTPTAAISDGNAGGNYAITLVASPTGVINAAPSLVAATAASRDLGQPNTPSGGTVSSPVGDEIEKTVEPPRTTTSQPATVIASIAQVQTAAQSIEQVQSAAQEIQKIATVNVLVPGRQDFVSRIVEGFDTKLKAPRQALFVVLPNEDGTVGAISVDDGKTVTLLDRPYAAAELRDGDTVAAEFGPDDAELIFGRGKTTRPKR
jgi:hypothetical protein